MKTYKTIEEEVQQANIFIDNYEKNEDVRIKLDVYGFGTEAILTGKTLLAEVNSKNQHQKAEVGQKCNATINCNMQFDKANNKIKVIFRIAKLALPEKGLFLQLGLENLAYTSFSSWAQNGIDFYTNALKNPTIMERLLKYKIKEADLQEGKRLIEVAINAHHEQVKETGDARIATEERNDALSELRKWYSEAKTIAKLALDKREYEKLGVE